MVDVHEWHGADIKGQIMAKMLNGTIPWNEGCYLRDIVDTFVEKEVQERVRKENLQTTEEIKTKV